MDWEDSKEREEFAKRKNIMEADNFTIVNSTNRKHKRLYFKNCFLRNAKNNHEFNETEPAFLSVKNIEDLHARIQREICQFFIQNVFKDLSSVIGNRKIIMLRSIGLGSFTSDRSSADQFILLQAIRKFWRIDLAVAQDPRTSSTEKSILESYKFRVLPSDNLLKQPTYSCLDSKQEGVTILYMIHCEHIMYNSILASYWNLKLLKNLIIIGNNLHSVVDNLSSKLLAKLPVLREYSKLCTCVNFDCDNYSFHSTAISYVPMDTDISITDFTNYIPDYDL